MPHFKSAAKQRYFHYLESKGKMPKKTVDEFDKATDFEHLPEKANMYDGGMVDDDNEYPSNNYDYHMGHASEYDSAGEPHTEDKLESVQPMEFMDKGGMVRDDNDIVHEDDAVPPELHEAHSHLSYEELLDHFNATKYMYRGGKIKKMAKGGMVPHPNFVRALRKSY